MRRFVGPVGAVVLGVTALIAVLTAVGVAGCSRTTEGSPVGTGPTGEEPTFPTPRPTRTTPPTTTPPPDTGTATPSPRGEVLRPQNGYVFIETKSGQTRCQLSADEVGCEAPFHDPPEVDGVPANGVNITADGAVRWVVGNLGAIPAVTLDYRTYSALGWTIEATRDGTRFTNDRTGHGMFVAVEGVETF